MSKAQAQGLMNISAELGSPTAYPRPGSRVITTLYALRKNDARGSGNVLTRSTPKPDCAMEAGETSGVESTPGAAVPLTEKFTKVVASWVLEFSLNTNVPIFPRVTLSVLLTVTTGNC